MSTEPNQLIPHEYHGITVLADKKGEVWLSQKQMAQLFGVSVRTINKIIHTGKNNNDITEDMATNQQVVTRDNKPYSIVLYNLYVVLLVGFRSRKSKEAEAFRRWVRDIIHRHLNPPTDADNLADLRDVVQMQRRTISTLVEELNILITRLNVFHNQFHFALSEYTDDFKRRERLSTALDRRALKALGEWEEKPE